MATETLKLSRVPSASFFLRRWLTGWAVVLILLGGFLAHDGALDTLAWRTTRWVMGSQDAYDWPAYHAAAAGHPHAPFYQSAEPPLHGKLYHRTEKLWRVLRDLGEGWVTLILLAGVWLYDRRRRWRAPVILLAATLLSGSVRVLLCLTAGRLRPAGELLDPLTLQRALDPLTGAFLRNEGDNYWYFLRGFDRHFGASDLSFPSGHATLAFATAAALCVLSPRGRWLFLALATGCALSRVVMQAHFYSDVLVGAALGYTVGHFVTVFLDRRLTRSNTRA